MCASVDVMNPTRIQNYLSDFSSITDPTYSMWHSEAFNHLGSDQDRRCLIFGDRTRTRISTWYGHAESLVGTFILLVYTNFVDMGKSENIRIANIHLAFSEFQGYIYYGSSQRTGDIWLI